MKTLSKPSTKTLLKNTRPEVELLLCCARTCIDTKANNQIQTLLRQDIDWTYLIQIAYQHGVMPLLYRSINTICPEAVPKNILNQLQSHFYANAQHNLFLTGELLKLLNLFATHDIPVIPYKGPALAALAYGNLTLRQFGDLDIVVHEQDITKAVNLLVSQGYQLPIQLTAGQARPYLQSEHFRESAQQDGSYNIVRNDGRAVVELHWKLTHKGFPFQIASDRLWENLKPISLAGTTVLNFVPEDMLLILCMHGTKDAWKQLKWICDIAALIHTHQQLDWEQVVKQAKTLGSQRMLFLGLLLANTLLETPLPEEIWQQLQADSTIQFLTKKICEQLFSHTNRKSEVDNKFLVQVRSREYLKDRSYIFFHYIMTPSGRDWELLPLPKYLYPLYYLLRPIRLIGEYGLGRAKHLFEF